MEMLATAYPRSVCQVQACKAFCDSSACTPAACGASSCCGGAGCALVAGVPGVAALLVAGVTGTGVARAASVLTGQRAC